MPRNGSYTLGEVTADRVVVECEICNRRGSYSTAGLVEKYGADVTMPDLKFKLVNCQNIDTSNLEPCKAVYSRETRMSWQRR